MPGARADAVALVCPFALGADAVLPSGEDAARACPPSSRAARSLPCQTPAGPASAGARGHTGPSARPVRRERTLASPALSPCQLRP